VTAMKKPTDGKNDFVQHILTQCKQLGLPAPELEHRFHPTRKWRFDLAWPDQMLAMEIDGGVYAEGRHTRGKGFEGDAEKLNEALILGWRVLRVTTGQVKSEKAIGWLERAVIEAPYPGPMMNY